MFDNIKTKYEDSEFIINEENSKIAINILKEKIKKDGETAELYCYLSKAFLPLEPQKAIECAKKAIKLDRNYLYAKTRLMYSYAMMCKKNKTLKLIDKILKADNINFYIYSLIMKAFNNIGISPEDEKYNQVLKILANPDNTPANTLEYEYKLLSCLGLKDYKLFDRYLKEAEEKNLLTSLTYCAISRFYFNQKQYDEALDFADKALAVNITCAYAYYIKSIILLKLKKHKQAVNNYYNSILSDYIYVEEFPNDCTFKDAIIFIYLIFKSAILYSCLCLIFDLKYIKFLSNYNAIISLIYVSNENYKEALLYADKAITEGEALPIAYLSKGLALSALGEYDNGLEALKIAEKFAVKLNDKDFLIGIYMGIAITYFCKTDYKNSLEYADKLIFIDPKISASYFIIGVYLDDKEDYDNALNAFLKAGQLGLFNESSYYGLFSYFKISYIYYKQNKLEKALEYINKAILINDKYTDLLYCKADILNNLGRKAEAQIYIKKAQNLKENRLLTNPATFKNIFKNF